MRRAAAPGALAAMLLLAACATAPAPRDRTSPGTGAEPFSVLAARFAERAAAQERSGNVHQALQFWRLVAALRPGAAEPARRVVELTARAKADGERHYRDALARLEAGDLHATRRELLLALLADPDHAGALETLKSRLEPDAVAYTVRLGDTFESIAAQHYRDAAKAVLIARANELDPLSRPATGTALLLPSLSTPTRAAPAKKGEALAAEPDEQQETATEMESAAPKVEAPVPAPAPAKPAESAEEQLAKAADLLTAGRFADAAAAAQRLATAEAVGKRARELATQAWFGLGDAELKADNFAGAATAYRKADPALRDIPTALAAVERRKREKAEEFYNDGVRLYINQRLDSAIRSWEQTLELNPEHPKAKKDIAKARALQQKLHDLR